MDVVRGREGGMWLVGVVCRCWLGGCSISMQEEAPVVIALSFKL